IGSASCVLFLCSRGCRRTARAPRCTLLTLFNQFLLPLQIFIEANRHVLDDGVLHVQTALELRDQFAVRRANLLVVIHPFAVLGHAVGQLSRAPVFALLDLRTLIRAGVFDRVQHLLNLVFRRRGTRDKNQIVQTLFHSSLVSSSYSGSALAAAANSYFPASSSFVSSGRRLNLFIAASIPSVNHNSTASAASATSSAATSSSAFFIGRSTYSLRLPSG